MGEMADMIIDQMIDEQLYGYGPNYYEYEPPKCMYCGSTPLVWQKLDTPGRETWRLFTQTGRLHKCKAYLKHRIKDAEKEMKEFINDA